MYRRQHHTTFIKRAFTIFCIVGEVGILSFFIFVCLILSLSLSSFRSSVQTYIIPTGSMVPTLSVGSLAFINPRYSSFGVGDIIAYTNPKNKKMTVIHRIMSKKIKTGIIQFQTKGDHNSGEDPWLVPQALVKGKLIFSIPFAGYIVASIKTLKGFYLYIVLPSVLAILFEFKRIVDGIEDEVKERTTKRVFQTILIPKLLLIFFLILQLGTLRMQAQAMLVVQAPLDKLIVHVKNFDGPSLTLIYHPTNHSVAFFVNRTSGFTNLSYALRYDTATISQEVIGQDSLLSQETYTSPQIVLGTCSANGMCVYDEDIHNIRIIVNLKGNLQSLILDKSL